MAANLNKTKRRINSVNSTKKITKAMELVATVKLKKFKDVMGDGNSYTNAIKEIISSLFSKLDEDLLAMLNKKKDAQKDLIIVINSNLGLCGSFNNDSYKYVENNVNKDTSVILSIGNKAKEHYSKEGYEVIDSYSSLNEKIEYVEITKLANFILSEFENGQYKSVKIVYTKYVNSIKFIPDQITLFPLAFEEQKEETGYAPIYDCDIKTLIEEIVPIYVTSTLYQKIVETQVSEQASRRNAMENATDNADELIDQLTLDYNKARQAAITAEITEVVSSTIK